MEYDCFESVKNQGGIGLKQDFLIYGKEYHLWRDGQYLGFAKYVDDENIGEAFIKEGVTDEGFICNQVFCADEWKLKTCDACPKCGSSEDIHELNNNYQCLICGHFWW